MSAPMKQPSGPLMTSPWTPGPFPDFSGRVVSVAVNFNPTTRALISAVLHRDSGCRWNTIVIGDPANPTYSFPCPKDGQGDDTATAGQLAAKGLTTIEQAMALQITAIFV